MVFRKAKPLVNDNPEGYPEFTITPLDVELWVRLASYQTVTLFDGPMRAAVEKAIAISETDHAFLRWAES